MTGTRALKISVVLCTWNGETFLNEQLLTLLTQSRLPDEVIIGDDASTDRTWELVEAFVVQAKTRGVLVRAERRIERLGYVLNFSQTLATASGDLIFLCDQDDAWHPDKIALMESRFLAEPTLILLHSDARLVAADGADLGSSLFDALELDDSERERVREGQAFDVYLRRNLATGAATAFRRELLEVALPIPSTWVHDAWLSALASATGIIGIVDDPLIDYRQHGGNQIGMRPRTLRTRLAEFRLPRGAELRDEAVRLHALGERLHLNGGYGVAQAGLAARLTHVSRRMALGDMPWVKRVPAVAREWFSGAYARFSTGHRTALRDLMRRG